MTSGPKSHAPRSSTKRTIAAFVIAGASLAGPLAFAQDARQFASGNVAEAEIVRALESAHPDKMRPVGTSSVVLQVDLSGPIDAAFRPETPMHPRGWLAEVAAYRVASAIGLDDVPPAVVRSVERGQLRRRLDPESGVEFDDLANECTFTGQMLRGAFVYWVPGLLRSDLDTPEGIGRWSRWLAQGGDIPDAERSTARDLSNMVLFDYLVANRDRWSGGNVRPAAGGRIVIRDHNLAFPPAMTEATHRRMLGYLRRSERFSRGTIARLRALDEAQLRASLAEPTLGDGQLVLDEAQIAAVLDRRDAALSYVGALIEAHGEDAVLAFE